MYISVLSGTFKGIESFLVNVEVDISPGLPMIELIGCLSKESKEAKERVHVALKNSGIKIPPMRITINLSPADINKSGTGFDLPIAVGILALIGNRNIDIFKNVLFIGELGLNGEVKPVKGVLPIVSMASKMGISACVLPKGNAMEASVLDNIDIYCVEYITEIIDCLEYGLDCLEYFSGKNEWNENNRVIKEDFADITGQNTIKRAAEVCAAGFHHMMIIGPPGSGKTMVARRMLSIMPPLSFEESKEVSSIYSICGKLIGGKLLDSRPFVAPHHGTTMAGLIGGGFNPHPGAVSLADRGILFLDELTEFDRTVLDSLRQPLEDKRVEIVRNRDSIILPANFLLIVAMNPCPCGYYPNSKKCRCDINKVNRYLSKISGPLIDRIDICVEAEEMSMNEIIEFKEGESSEKIAERVARARDMQKKRFAGRDDIHFNGDMTAEDIRKYCKLGSAEKKLLSSSFEIFGISSRSYSKILKTARTIADLAGAENIEGEHISEAVFYKSAVNNYWN